MEIEKTLQADQELITIEKSIPELVSHAKGLKVTNELEGKTANEISLGLKKTISKLEARRKYHVEPLNEALKRINNSFKAKTEPIKEVFNIVREKLSTYMIAENRKKEVEAKDKNNKAKEFLGDEAKEQAPKPQTQVTSSFGKSFITKRWTWELFDINIVPKEYLILDEKKINQMIKAHTSTVKGESKCDLKIAGIKVFQKEGIGQR